MVSLCVFLFLFTATTCAELPQEIVNLFLNAPIPFQAIPLSQDESNTCDETKFEKSLDEYMKKLNFTGLPSVGDYLIKMGRILVEGGEKIRQFCELEDSFAKDIGETFDACVDPKALEKNQHLNETDAMLYSLQFIMYKVLCGQENLEIFLKSSDCLFVHPDKTMRTELEKCGQEEQKMLEDANCTTAHPQQRPCCSIFQWLLDCSSSAYKEGCGKDTGDLMCKVGKEIITASISSHLACKLTCTSPPTPTPSPTPSSSSGPGRIIWLLGIAHAILFSLKLM